MPTINEVNDQDGGVQATVENVLVTDGSESSADVPHQSQATGSGAGGIPGMMPMGGPPRPPGGLPVLGSQDDMPTVPSFDDEDDDDEQDETLGERLIGLTEMLPESLRKLTATTLETSVRSTKWIYGAARTGLWVLASSAAILALPVMFESERAQMEEQQIAQQRQILLGPNAAVSGVGGGPGGLMPGAMPHVMPPQPAR